MPHPPTRSDRVFTALWRAIFVLAVACALLLIFGGFVRQDIARDLEVFRVLILVIGGLLTFLLKMGWDEIKSLRKHAHWNRNCWTALGVKLDLELPKEHDI